ncbi:putative cytosolic iron-sulfur protein assembly protein CIAO1-like protein [Smittium culicis]|uniref:Putative cytosolic iron-sulfur protein assembly protein CIAO1-like protein n=1 Tax=Smittium culicis TaxID=133412 RepID=A0A1R1XKY4_9FUNG|nr:putative cytosolic iron-sulfur protein assembly protein CIAO1-like protein [Smittium culicis]
MCKLTEIQVLTGHEGQVWKVRWNPAGDRLLSCSGDKSIRLWAPLNPSILKQIHSPPSRKDSGWTCLFNLDNAHKRAVRHVCFEPTSGQVFASASFDGTCAIWDQNYSKGS